MHYNKIKREENAIMTTVTISLPDSLKDFLEAEVARGGYPTPSDYLRALIQEEHER